MTASQRHNVERSVVTTVADILAAKAAASAGNQPRLGDQLMHQNGAQVQFQLRPDTGAVRVVGPGVDICDVAADVDLSTYIGKAVKMNAATGRWTPCTALGERPAGILTFVDSAAVGAGCIVRVYGECFAHNTGGVSAFAMAATRADASLGALQGLKTDAAPNTVVQIQGGYALGFWLENAATLTLGRFLVTHTGGVPSTFL